MSRLFSRFALTAALLFVPAGLAVAGDTYVDAVNGDNANSGASWSTAWRTLTFAVAKSLPGEVLHIAPGVYDQALGETFPISPGDRALLCDEGYAVLDGGGASVTLLRSPSSVRGLWLQNAAIGVSYPELGSDTRLSDVVITGMSDRGVVAHAEFLYALQATYTDKLLTVERARVSGCAKAGLWLEYFSEALDSDYVFGARLVCADSEVNDNTVAFVATHSSGSAPYGGGALLQVRRSRVHHNGAFNAGEAPWGPTSGSIGSSVVHANGEGPRELNVFNSTVVANLGAGVRAEHTSRTVRNSIVWGNGEDFVGSGVVAYLCFVGHDSAAGINSNLSGDPLFVGYADGDYRLRWGSPCIDTGDPTTGPAATDLAGRSRWIDGDLDLMATPDRGAYEFAPLAQRGEAVVGGQLVFELWGPYPAASALMMSLGPPVALPARTTAGALWLQPKAIVHVGTFTAGEPDPGVAVLPVPAVPDLFDGVCSFQAVTLVGQPVLTNVEVVRIR